MDEPARALGVASIARPVRRRLASVGLMAFVVWLTGAKDLAAQATGESSTILGRVVDAASGEPLVNAIVAVPARSIAVLSSEDGSFRLERVPTGTQILRVQQFGYAELVEVVTVAGPTLDVVIELQPAPLPVQGLDVVVEGSMTLAGRVVDGDSGQPISGAYVWLGTEERGGLSDAGGAFHFDAVATGPVLIQAEAVGYGRQYLPYYLFESAAAPQITMYADSAVLRGLPLAEQRLHGRRNASPGVVMVLDRTELATRPADNARLFVDKYTLARMVACSGAARSHWCVDAGGEPLEAVVCIDGEVMMGGLDDLQRYRPHELYMVEVYGVRGTSVRAYTYAFMEELARSGVELMGAEPEAQRAGVDGVGWQTRGPEPSAVEAASWLATRC